MQQVKASVQPHGHTQEFGGPVDVAIGVRVQPPLLRTWDTKVKPKFCLDQPDPDSNLTLIRILFTKEPAPHPDQFLDTIVTGCSPWHRANVYRKNNFRRQIKEDDGTVKDIEPGGVIVVAIKGRYTNGLAHPLPMGKYQGVCEEGKGWVLFTLQARTLIRKQVEEKRNILQPGDFQYQETVNALTPRQDTKLIYRDARLEG